MVQAGSSPSPDYVVGASEPVNGLAVIALRKVRVAEPARLEIVEAGIQPGAGMKVTHLHAYIPGRGIIEMLETGPHIGVAGGILLPWANRIRGRLSADQQTIETTVLGKTLHLPANKQGKEPGAEKHSIHGFLAHMAMAQVRTSGGDTGAIAEATVNAGDFGGRWLSAMQVAVATRLEGGAFAFDVTARNVGAEPAPVGIGWHPNFMIPSGRREQAILRIPAKRRALVDNYDNVFPTGEIVPVTGTPYDFSGPDGAPLGNLYFDECFLDLQRQADGRVVSEMIDPAAKFGVRVIAASPEVRAVQVFAPLNRSIAAIEPQFNLAEPYSGIWGREADNGMVVLQPGQPVTYSVRVELFVP